MIFLQLFLEFFKIGVFSVGGGYATMPFLYHIVEKWGWYTTNQLTNMIAVSIITPGPVGANMATFAGFQTAGVLGGILATLSLVAPSYIIVVSVSKILKTFADNFWIKAIIYSLKPAGCGLLVAVGVDFFRHNVTNLSGLLLFVFLFGLSFKFKKNLLLYFVIAGIVGISLELVKIYIING